MKTTNKDFEIFKKEFCQWQEKLGLLRYKIYFQRKDLSLEDGEVFANITRDEGGKTATVRLTSKIRYNENVSHFDPQLTAKHEAIHLLLSELLDAARGRYGFPDDIGRAEEAIVRVLEKVL